VPAEEVLPGLGDLWLGEGRGQRPRAGVLGFLWRVLPGRQVFLTVTRVGWTAGAKLNGKGARAWLGVGL
jgi:hypothetical protein